MSIDWDKIKTEYETTGISLKELADKYGVKYATVRTRKNREKWKRNTETLNETKHETGVSTQQEISWVDIENEYVTDIRKKPCTLRGLADKYLISMSRISKYATENNWTSKREKYAKTVNKKTIDILSLEHAKVKAKHFRVSDKLLNTLEKSLDDDTELYKYVEKLRTGYGPGEFKEELSTEVLDAINDGKLLNIVNSLEKLQKMQRQTIGIMDKKDEVSKELAREKLDLEKSKIMGEDDELEDDGFIEALNAEVADVWSDEDDEEE